MDKFTPNGKNTTIRALYARTKILVPFYKVWPWNQLKGLDVFSVIRLKDEVKFSIGKILQVLYFPSTFVVKTKNLE